jgi:hypothetical protein
MDNTSAKKTEAGGNPGLFQLDIDLYEQQALDEFVAGQLAEFMKENYPDIDPVSGEKLFHDSRYFEFKIMLWLSPGEYLVLPFLFSFDYSETARVQGTYLAPYGVKGSVTFDFPVGNVTSYVITVRVQQTYDCLLALQAIVRDIVAFSTRLFLSEVITE